MHKISALKFIGRVLINKHDKNVQSIYISLFDHLAKNKKQFLCFMLKHTNTYILTTFSVSLFMHSYVCMYFHIHTYM